MNAIQISDLTKYYGKTRGVTNLDLTVKKGECFGFIGPNGAGKSTTIRILTGLIRPTSGQAQVFDMDVTRAKEQILSRTGYLPSETAFYPGMTAKEILRFSAALRKKDCSARARQLCQRLDLHMDLRADRASLGNRKKIAIVCALQHDPDLLILDEPTSGLDPLIQREFFTILKERNAQGATIFLSSHVLSEIWHHCARAAVIREGRIVACGPVETLTQTRTKQITIHGDVDLDGLPDIRSLKKTNGLFSFFYDGDLNRLLSTLAAGNITDLSVSEPDLEEIFFHYYKDGGKKNDPSET